MPALLVGELKGLNALERSRAPWNRTHLDVRSDAQLAQILDRGEMAAWRELYRLARTEPELRRRIAHIVSTVPASGSSRLGEVGGRR